MSKVTYYDVAIQDYEFLEYYFGYLDNAPSYNAFAVQEYNVVEMLLKDVLNCYVDSVDVVGLLKSHKLASILREIKKCFPDCPLEMNDMRFLSDFYFDGRYPSSDYVLVEKKEAIEGFRITKDVLKWVKSIKESNMGTKPINAF